MYKIRVVDSVAQCNGLESSWDKLLARSAHPTVFNTFAWAACWLQVYWQENYALKIVLVETGGELVALLPLYIQMHTGTCWFIGSGEPEAEEVASEYLDFIVHQEHAGSVELAACITAQLEMLNQYRLILVNCCASAYAANLLRKHRRALYTVTGVTYTLVMEDTFADTAKVFSKNHLKSARQCLNRFNAAPDLEYVAFHSNDFQNDWQALKILHQQDWTARGETGAFHSTSFTRFHALMYTQQPQIRQVFVALRQKGEPLAMHHFYVFGNTYYFYLAATDKVRERRLSPGLMLHALSMQELSGTGVVFDFLKGKIGNSYKAKFCPAGEEFYTITVFENSPGGTVRHWLVRLKRYIKGRLGSAKAHKKSGNED